jgi:hypothetical protein
MLERRVRVLDACGLGVFNMLVDWERLAEDAIPCAQMILQ